MRVNEVRSECASAAFDLATGKQPQHGEPGESRQHDPPQRLDAHALVGVTVRIFFAQPSLIYGQDTQHANIVSALDQRANLA